ncbi:reverse transcriptase domain-containing protein [Tanacetum coccineum]
MENSRSKVVEETKVSAKGSASELRHGYAVSSLMDTAYRMSELYSSYFFIKYSIMAPSVGPETISPVQTESITTKPRDLLLLHDKRERDDTTPGFSTLNPLPDPNASELPPITTSTFTARTPENAPLTNRASTLNNLDPMISPAFVEANYEVLESLLKEHIRQMHNEDLHTKLEYFSEEHKERVVEFEDAPNKEGSRVERNDEGGRPLGQRVEDNRPQGMNLPLLLAGHLGRSENVQPLQSTLTSIHEGRHPSTNIGGNLPPNGSGGSSSFGGPLTYYSYGGYALQALAGGSVPVSHRLIHPSGVFPNTYPFNAQPMYPLPNAPIYPNQAPSGLFADYTGSITPFVRWIEDNPLPDRLKMPSHVGSYDGKGDPDNFLHLFEGAIHMQKWACPWPIICSPLRLMILPEYGGIVKRQCITSSRRKEKALELSLLEEGPFVRTEILDFVIVRSNSLHNLILGRTTMQKMGIVVSIIHRAIKFHTLKGVDTVLSTYEPDKIGEGQKKLKEASQEATKDTLSCMSTEEEIIINNKYPDQTVIIGRQLPTSFNKRLRDLLKENADIITWTYSDMMGIPKTIMERSTPQRSRRADKGEHPARSQIPDMGIKPYYYKKDAYKGYHQIPMAKGDKEKTAFFTREGVFCYKRLPFGLKNAGATYQRLVDTVFSNQIGRNLEVHVDDMVIKSDSKEDMLANIQETFDKLRAINMKLNPRKCSFGVEEGPFLGYLITKQGIKANPTKVKEISDLKLPKTIKEIQSAEELCKKEDSSMDARGRRSFPENEGVHRNITHGGSPNQRRNPGNVPSSLGRKYKCSFTSRKRKEANPHLFCKPITKRGRNRISRAGKTHTSPRICRKKALAKKEDRRSRHLRGLPKAHTYSHAEGDSQ